MSTSQALLSGKLQTIEEPFQSCDVTSLPPMHVLQWADPWFLLGRESSKTSLLNVRALSTFLKLQHIPQ